MNGNPNGDLFDQSDQLEDVRRHTHRGGLSSEIRAAIKAAPSMQPMRDRILKDVDAAGAYGLTPDEWCDRNKALINTVRRRFTDLWKDGLIRHHEDLKTRKNRAGNDCVVWVLGAAPDATKLRSTPLHELRERVEMLERQVRELRELMERLA